MSAILAGTQVLADTGWGWDHMDGGGWVLMAIGMAIFWGLVIFGIVWLVRALTEHRSPGVEPHGTASSPLEILQRHLADGSITVEDYEERRRFLAHDS